MQGMYVVAEASAELDSNRSYRSDAQFMYSLVSLSNQRIYEITSDMGSPVEMPQRDFQQFVQMYTYASDNETSEIVPHNDAPEPRVIGSSGSGQHWRETSLENRAFVEHWFNWNISTTLGPGFFDSRVAITNGGLRGFSLAGPQNTNSIVLRETIVRYGNAFSFSFPWGITWSPQATREDWVSASFTQDLMVTMVRPNFSGQWVTRPLWQRDLFSITSSADVAIRDAQGWSRILRPTVGVTVNAY